MPTSRDHEPDIRGNGERPPELTAEQVDLALTVARQALAGNKYTLHGNREGELCAIPIHEGPKKRAQ